MDINKPNSHDKNLYNRISAIVFAASIAGILLACILTHWLNRLTTRCLSKSTALGRIVTSINNLVRGSLARKTFNIVHGRLLVGLLYLAANITLTVINLDFTQVSYAARRLGWMAICNFSLTIVLALQNSPWARLLGKSHQTVSKVHHITGVTTVVFILAHGSLFATSLSIKHALDNLQSPRQGTALIAAIMLLLLLTTALPAFRRGQYETFKFLHNVFVVSAILLAGYHLIPTPFTLEALPQHPPFLILLATFGIYIVSHLLRLFACLHSLSTNKIMIHPLPGPIPATRITLVRPLLADHSPGSHYQLYLPTLSPFQTHPFTLLSPTTLVIQAHSGLTRKLYNLALTQPGVTIRAALIGPYRPPHNLDADTLARFDQVVLFGGGSGGTFILSVALAWVQRFEEMKARGLGVLARNRGLEVVWSVKKRECFEWCKEELETVMGCEGVRLSLHVTGEEEEEEEQRWELAEKDVEEWQGGVIAENDVERAVVRYEGPPTIRVVHGMVTGLPRETIVAPLPPTSPKKVEVVVDEVTEGDPEVSKFWDMTSKVTMKGRPDMDDTLYATTEHLWKGKRILVAACGPKGLLEDTRKAVVSRMTTDRPEMQLHLEYF